MSKRTWTPLRVCLWQSFGGRKKYWQDVRALPLLKSFQTEKNLIPPAWQAPLSVIISQPHVVLETIMVGLQGREKSLMTLSLSVSIQYRRVTERSIARVKKKRKQYIRLHTITHTWKHMIATLGSNMYSLWISSTLLWRRQGEANRVTHDSGAGASTWLKLFNSVNVLARAGGAFSAAVVYICFICRRRQQENDNVTQYESDM